MNNKIDSISIVIPAYNAEKTILRLLQSINHQEVTQNIKIEVVITDDASVDNTRSIVQGFTFDNKCNVLKLISHPINKGRSCTLNTAINHSSSNYCITIDSDCWFEENDIIHLFIMQFQQDKSLCFGFTSGLSTDFWGKYHQALYKKRVSTNSIEAQTTANFGFNKALVLSVGGFCTQYTHYGFEDRDLILSLKKVTPIKDIAINPFIIAIHVDELLVSDVAKKMYLCAKYSSITFNSRFPKEYRQSIYGCIDSTINKRYYSLLLKYMSPSYMYLIPLCQKAIQQQWIPFTLKKLIIKVISALAFAKGCKDKNVAST